MFDITKNLKVQTYLNNQNISDDTLNFLDSMKFNEMYTAEEFADIKYKVDKYRTLDTENRRNPSAEASKLMSELAQDILYSTGKDASKIQLSELFTTDKLDQAFMKTNLRSKNDLWVDIDYDDYSSSSNYVKLNIVGHDHPGAYGISANARMVITKNGTIITTKNALYMK